MEVSETELERDSGTAEGKRRKHRKQYRSACKPYFIRSNEQQATGLEPKRSRPSGTIENLLEKWKGYDRIAVSPEEG